MLLSPSLSLDVGVCLQFSRLLSQASDFLSEAGDGLVGVPRLCSGCIEVLRDLGTGVSCLFQCGSHTLEVSEELVVAGSQSRSLASERCDSGTEGCDLGPQVVIVSGQGERVLNSLDLDSPGNAQESLALPEQICTLGVFLKSLGSLVSLDAFMGQGLSSGGQLLVVGSAPCDQLLFRLGLVQLPEGSLTGLRSEESLGGKGGSHSGSPLRSLESGLECLDSGEKIPTLSKGVQVS